MAEEKIKRCTECGCTEIGSGKFAGHAALRPVDKFFGTGSVIYADVCTNCGLVTNLRAEKPEKFKMASS